MRYLLSLISLFVFATATGQENPVKWTYEVGPAEGNVYRVVFTAEIESPWHMYDLGPYVDGPNPTVFTFGAGKGIKLQGDIVPLEEPESVYDEMFGMRIGYYSSKASFAQGFRVTGREASLTADIEWMVCDRGVCLPPRDTTFIIEFNADGMMPGAEYAGAGENTGELLPYGEKSSGSLWALIIEAILWGFAALLTPCVFPMVPMTVSFFMKSGASPSRGRFNASMYGLFIIGLYTLPIAAIIIITRIVGGEAVTADIFNWLATHWIPNIIFFLVFMLFAASFFGAFEIRMPGKLVNRSDAKADKGGLGGIFFMALTLVLVSFSCTGPIVGSVLIKSTAGEFWEPIVTMLAFSVAFALPFTLLAFFPSLLTRLPKSGGWLNSVKVVLGFIEVALGLKFLSVADQTYHWGILDREIYLAIWIVVFTLMGFYLLGKIKFKHDSEVKYLGVGRLALVIATFSFVVYLIPGMWGAPLKGLSGYLPPMHTQDFVAGKYMGEEPQAGGKLPKHSDFLSLPHGLTGFFDYDEALEYARKENKPLLVDFTGHGCVNCREMEAKVWSDPEVLALLRDKFVIAALYSDDKTRLPESDWVKMPEGKTLKTLGRINSYVARAKFGANAQPYYIIVDGDENIIATRGYGLDIPSYIDFLKVAAATPVPAGTPIN